MESCTLKKPKDFKGKWRGIPTTIEPKNEDQAKTITNRLGQKSISLPRIDDKKRWAGYAGIAGVSKKIASLIPDHDYYIEPLAGTAKVMQELIKLKPDHSGIILNDKSWFIYNWLQKEFGDKVMAITNVDFVDSVKLWDSKRAFFLFDEPWFRSSYDQNFSCFNRSSTNEYDTEIISLCSGIPHNDFNKEGYKIQGDFMIATRKENIRMLNSGFNHIFVKSIYCVSGHYPEVLITTNLKVKGKHI
jgi:hypothetical protein